MDKRMDELRRAWEESLKLCVVIHQLEEEIQDLVRVPAEEPGIDIKQVVTTDSLRKAAEKLKRVRELQEQRERALERWLSLSEEC